DQLDVLQASRVDPVARDREHPRRHVDGDDSPRRSDGAGRGQRGLAAAGCDIEHAIAGAHYRQLDEPVVDELRGALKRGPPSLPSFSAIVPRGLLLAFHFQIVGLLIAHGNFTFALPLRRAAVRPLADSPFYRIERRRARGSARLESTLRL